MDDYTHLQNSLKDRDSFESFGISPKIILVEDDRLLGLSIKRYLESTINADVSLFASSMDTMEYLLNSNQGSHPFCLVTDISLEKGGDGLILIDNLKEKNLNFISIAMTGFASIENAIKATKQGVFHYLTKPFEMEVLKDLVVKAIAKKFDIGVGVQKVSPKRLDVEEPQMDDYFMGMIGRSPAMKELFERIKKVAYTDSTVMINGASGTGKELITAAIHELSERRKSKKISVNCGAIPAELLESELFGHVKGSFTGAISDRKGRFELANSGTLFLDEIGDMPLNLQVKILRALQDRQIQPVGSEKVVSIDTRVIAATHRNLDEMVAQKTFREDLYYRLNVIPLFVPSLKERKEDIPLLISHFLKKFTSVNNSNSIHFTAPALKLMIDYDWPGNVRELENIVERLVILRGGHDILPEDLPAKIFRHNPLANNSYANLFELPTEGIDLKKILGEIESSLIDQALELTDGNKNQASKLLSLNRTTLIEKIKKRPSMDL